MYAAQHAQVSARCSRSLLLLLLRLLHAQQQGRGVGPLEGSSNEWNGTLWAACISPEVLYCF